MADVFISYAREDRNWVRGLAQALEAEGLSVWWDPNLLPGSRYRETIEKELEQAYASIVVWSEDSIQSDFVRDEAEEARVLNRLIPVLKDAVQPPHGFRQIQTADLSEWRGKRDHSEYVLVLEGIQALAAARKGHAVPAPKPRPVPVSWIDRLKSPAGMGIAAAAILVAVVLAFFVGRSGTDPQASQPFEQTTMQPAQPMQQAAPVNPAQMTPAEKLATCLADQQAAQIMVTVCTDALQTPNLPPQNLARVRANRGISYVELKQYQNGLNDLNVALDLDPKDEVAVLNRGFAYYNLGQYEAAGAEYNKAIELNPNDASAIGARGDLESRNWQLGAAINDYQKATQLRPNDFLGWKSLCLTRAMAGTDLTQAVSECNHAIELEPTGWGAMDALGLAKLRLMDNQGAIEAFTRALSFQPNLATSLYGRAMAKQRLGNAAEASQDFYAARAVRSDIDSLYSHMGLTQ